MTVLLFVKAVDDWCREHEGEGFNCYEEAHRRFGRWIHSVSYVSCIGLREEVERYLESKGVDFRFIFAAARLFCGPMSVEVKYDEQVYRVLKEALRYIADSNEEAIIRSHANILIELITTAEKLKGSIICSG